MKLKELAQQLALEVCSAAGKLDVEVTGGYTSDLLSYVMAKAKAGNVWITVQSHPNIVAVASLLNLAGIVITQNGKPDAVTVEKANQEGVPILTTPLTTYQVVGKLFELGVRGVD